MAESLPTTGVSYRLEEIITSATKRLVIISPFLKIHERIKGLLAKPPSCGRKRMTG